MNTPHVEVMLEIARAHQREIRRDAEQQRLVKLALGDLPRRSVLKLLTAIFQHDEPAIEVVATTEMPALTDPLKTQTVNVIRRTDEIRRTFYENIRQGNALQEMEEQTERQWQAGGA
jgi:hypothetical protein